MSKTTLPVPAERLDQLFGNFKSTFFASCGTHELLISDGELRAIFEERCAASLERQRAAARKSADALFARVESELEKSYAPKQPATIKFAAEITAALAPHIETTMANLARSVRERGQEKANDIARQIVLAAMRNWEEKIRGDAEKAAAEALETLRGNLGQQIVQLVMEQVGSDTAVLAEKYAANLSESARKKFTASMDQFFKTRLAEALELFAPAKLLPAKKKCIYHGDWKAWHPHPKGALVQTSRNTIVLCTLNGNKPQTVVSGVQDFPRWIPHAEGVLLCWDDDRDYGFWKINGEDLEMLSLPEDRHGESVHGDWFRPVASHPQGYCFTTRTESEEDKGFDVVQVGVSTIGGRILGALHTLKDGELWFPHPEGLLLCSGGFFSLDHMDSHGELPVDPVSAMEVISLNWLQPEGGRVVEGADGLYFVPENS